MVAVLGPYEALPYYIHTYNEKTVYACVQWNASTVDSLFQQQNIQILALESVSILEKFQ
jgi:hypothetical protein